MKDRKTPDILLPALRQYQHNDCSGLLAGFDHDETVKIVEKMLAEQREACANAIDKYADEYLIGESLETAIQCIDICLNATGEE